MGRGRIRCEQVWAGVGQVWAEVGLALKLPGGNEWEQSQEKPPAECVQLLWSSLWVRRTCPVREGRATLSRTLPMIRADSPAHRIWCRAREAPETPYW